MPKNPRLNRMLKERVNMTEVWRVRANPLAAASCIYKALLNLEPPACVCTQGGAADRWGIDESISFYFFFFLEIRFCDLPNWRVGCSGVKFVIGWKGSFFFLYRPFFEMIKRGNNWLVFFFICQEVNKWFLISHGFGNVNTYVQRFHFK